LLLVLFLDFAICCSCKKTAWDVGAKLNLHFTNETFSVGAVELARVSATWKPSFMGVGWRQLIMPGFST